MYKVFRPFLFRFDPEVIHDLTICMLWLAGQNPAARLLLSRIFSVPDMPVRVCGIKFRNPVGLAAGFDKDGLGWKGLASLGFGHIEIGTVTYRPQPGNPKPRVFRLVDDQALINRMGFPGKGADYVQRMLKGERPRDLVIGINIGKNKDTPLEEAGDEYAELVRLFGPLADYLTVNISSPNTAGLRDLQERDALEDLLTQIAKSRRDVVVKNNKSKNLPIFIKLAPDLSMQSIDQALDVVEHTGMDGVILTNTTTSRYGLHSKSRDELGGLSGAPLFELSLEKVKYAAKTSSGRFSIIAAGGIMNADYARQMLEAGASLVQVYTGLIYEGPGFVREIVTGLASTG
jgi:dihydroorotate dehydrogenase